jgi:hypothetical protein
LRWLVRSLGARSPSSAPIWVETSASINSATTHATDSRKTSRWSSLISLSTTWEAVILRSSAIVVLLSSVAWS